MAHIQEVPTDYGTRYEVHWRTRVSGKPKWQQKSFRRKKDAQQYKTLIEADRLRGEIADVSAARRPFRDFAESYLRSLEVKDRTRKGYREVLDKWVLPRFGDDPIGDVTPADAREFRDELKAAGLAPSSVRYVFRTFRGTLALAIEDKALRFNPAAGVKLPTTKTEGREKFEPCWLKPAEVAALADEFADAPYRLLILFAAYTGLRAGEVAGLDVRDVTLTRAPAGWTGRVAVRRTRRRVPRRLAPSGWETTSPKSDRSARRVPMPPWLAAEIRVYLDTHPRRDDPAAPLWPGRTGRLGALDWDTPWDNMRFYRYEMKPALRRAGLPVAADGARGVRFHDLRHSYASISLSEGLELYRLSERMGHQSIVITQMLYGHLVDEDHAADVARLARPVAPPRRATISDRPLRAV